MVFNSIEFLLFFPIVTVIYFLLPYKFRWIHLLSASCLFYMAFVPIYILILFATIIIDYVAGILIEKAEGNRRKWFLIMSIAANVGMLAFFKYYNFFADNMNGLFSWTHVHANIPLLNIILPIGLSFHTFQAMSYTIEVYLNDQKAEKHLGIYALYVMFYPQLVAGPIERPQNLLHQFHQKHKFEYDDVVSGLRLMMWGMFKKTVIADRLALVTDPVYNNPHDYPGITLAIATVFFAFQMFCDFSGYSDIAIGAARIMGFKLMLNFDRPFKSKSLTEFWRRWHISLSSWLFDYIFNPIVFSFRYWGKAGMVVGLLVTFLVSGIWHGAGWKFILCGFLQGLGLVYEYLTKKQRKIMFGKLPQWLNDRLSIIFTFCYMSFTWIFFRANTLDDAFYVLGKIPSAATDCVEVIHKGISYIHLPLSNYKMILCVAVICIMELVHRMQGKAGFHSVFKTRPRYIKWGVYYFFVFMILYMGVYQNRQFIYFQF